MPQSGICAPRVVLSFSIRSTLSYCYFQTIQRYGINDFSALSEPRPVAPSSRPLLRPPAPPALAAAVFTSSGSIPFGPCSLQNRLYGKYLGACARPRPAKPRPLFVHISKKLLRKTVRNSHGLGERRPVKLLVFRRARLLAYKKRESPKTRRAVQRGGAALTVPRCRAGRSCRSFRSGCSRRRSARPSARRRRGRGTSSSTLVARIASGILSSLPILRSTAAT